MNSFCAEETRGCGGEGEIYPTSQSHVHDLRGEFGQTMPLARCLNTCFVLGSVWGTVVEKGSVSGPGH